MREIREALDGLVELGACGAAELIYLRWLQSDGDFLEGVTVDGVPVRKWVYERLEGLVELGPGRPQISVSDRRP